MTLVTVMRNRYVKSWPVEDAPQPERAYVIELGAALTREYSSDAHFTAYRSPVGHRLNREAVERLEGIELTCVTFDIDCAATHGTSEPAPESWRQELRAKVQTLATVHPGPFYYETKGGGRIVYRQPEPTILRTQDDAQQWSQIYAVAVSYLSRRFAIEADAACNDWQRLYRLPHATRDAGGKPENWPTWGDAQAIGALLIEASPSDLTKAKSKSKAFAERKAANLATYAGTGEGLLFHLLDARRDVVKAAPRGGWICLCPNRAQHSCKTDGSDSTVVYPPLVGEQVGFVACKHAHCENLKARDWLRLFSPSELEAARRAAGIVRAA